MSIDIETPGGGGGGTTDHSALSNLGYSASSHTGFEATIETGTTAQFYRGDKTWQLVPDTGGGAGVVYAPTGATYIVQVASATLSNEQALADLNTGILKSTSGTGLVSIAVSGTDYEAPIPTGTTSQFWRGDKTWATPSDYYNFTLLPQGAVLDDNNPPAITIIESTGTGTPRFYVADFDATTDEILYWTLIVPDDMGSGNWLADVSWFTNTTASNATCVWEIAVSATTEADADTMAEQAVATSNTASEDANTTEANRLIQTTITMTNLDSVAVSDVITLRFNRDANNVSDDLSSDARLISVRLRIPRAD